MTYGRDEYEQDQMDRGREQQDREEYERDVAGVNDVEDYAYDEDVAYEGTEYAESDW